MFSRDRKCIQMNAIHKEALLGSGMPGAERFAMRCHSSWLRALHLSGRM